MKTIRNKIEEIVTQVAGYDDDKVMISKYTDKLLNLMKEKMKKIVGEDETITYADGYDAVMTEGQNRLRKKQREIISSIDKISQGSQKRCKIEIEIPDTLHRNIGFNQAVDQMRASIKELKKEL